MNLRDNSPEARKKRTGVLAAMLVVLLVTYLALPKSWFEMPKKQGAQVAPEVADKPMSLVELQQASAKSPLDFELHSRLAIALSQVSKTEEAEKEFKATLRLAPKAPLAYHNYAVFLLNRDRAVEAEALFARELETSPADGRAHYFRGTALQSLKRLPDAAMEYELATKLAPSFPESYLALATLLTEKRPPELIKQYVDKYLELNGANVGLANHALSRAYRTKQKYAEAAAAAEIATKTEPKNYAYVRNLGQIYMAMQRFDDADRTLRAAAALARDASPVYIEIGMNLQKAGRFPQTVEAFRKALEISPETGNIHQYLARVYQRMGNQAEAAKEEAAFRAWELKLSREENAKNLKLVKPTKP